MSKTVPTPTSRATGRITLADVARASGVSPITVSRALRGERAVDPVLVSRVHDAAKTLGYVPDPAARALASRHSAHIAVLIPMLSNTLFVDLLEAAQDTFRQAGFQTLMGVTHYNLDEEEHLLREQLMHRPSGLLVTGFARHETTRNLIKQSGIPCVHMMEYEPLETHHASDRPTYSVGFSHVNSSAQMTRYLLNQGYRHIAFAAAQLDPRTLQRLEGWQMALNEVALFSENLQFLDSAVSSIALGGKMFAHIIQSQPQVDAIFFCNDDLAQGALLMALRMNIKIPEQVAIAGFNDLSGSDQMLPPLTTVRTPRAEIGREAANMLLALIKGKPVETPCKNLGYELIVRASTGRKTGVPV